jgi:hypothetical protein
VRIKLNLISTDLPLELFFVVVLEGSRLSLTQLTDFRFARKRPTMTDRFSGRLILIRKLSNEVWNLDDKDSIEGTIDTLFRCNLWVARQLSLQRIWSKRKPKRDRKGVFISLPHHPACGSAPGGYQEHRTVVR